MKFSNDIYTMSLAIGTPPKPFSAIMDTGSNLIWTKCKSSGSGLYDTSMSTSFSNHIDDSCEELGLGQNCQQKYDDGKVSVSVTLGQETLTIEDQKYNNVTFGCGKPNDKNFNCGGIVGMGPGKSSLVSHLEKRVFSYCLSPTASNVWLTGSEASIRDTNIQTTPLVTDELYYYISLEGISVGETKLPLTKSDFPSSYEYAGGMIIDSGTAFTYLEQRIIDMISDEFMNQTKLEKCKDNVTPYGHVLEHCFKHQGNNVHFPNLIFHFEGANWELPRENYIYEKKGVNEGCLAFLANKNTEKLSIFGNMQQQNMMVTYDLEKKSLSIFKPANCN
ncbi:putative nepenthesin [Helianthus debilis subsp. tardiflorus]